MLLSAKWKKKNLKIHPDSFSRFCVYPLSLRPAPVLSHRTPPPLFLNLQGNFHTRARCRRVPEELASSSQLPPMGGRTERFQVQRGINPLDSAFLNVVTGLLPDLSSGQSQ